MNNNTIQKLLKLRLERELKTARKLADAKIRLHETEMHRVTAQQTLEHAANQRRQVSQRLYREIRNEKLKGYEFQARLARIAALDVPVNQAQRQLDEAEQSVKTLAGELDERRKQHLIATREKMKWEQLEKDQAVRLMTADIDRQEREADEQSIDRHWVKVKTSISVQHEEGCAP